MTGRNHVVYIIRRPANSGDERSYIGVSSYTKTQSPQKRWSCHKSSKTHVGRFIRKYDDTYMQILIRNLTKKEAYALEEALVPSSPKARKEMQLLNERSGGVHPPNYRNLSAIAQKRKSEKISKALHRHYQHPEARERRRKEMLEYHQQNPALVAAIAKRQRSFQESRRKKYALMSPTGTVVTHVDMLLCDLANKIGVAPTNLSAVVNGKIKSIKGWRLPANKDYMPPRTLDFCLRDPQGRLHRGTNVKAFCDANNLDHCYVRRMIKGKQGVEKYKRYKSHRGWIAVNPSDN